MGNGINSTPYADMRALLVYASERCLAVAESWNSYFFWKVHSVKRINMKRESLSSYALDRFASDDGIYADWCDNVESYSDDNFTNDNEYAYVCVMFERTVRSPLLNELASLQEECEACFGTIDDVDNRAESLSKQARSIFRKTREEGLREIEEGKRKKAEAFTRLEHAMARVNEIRTAILGDA